MPVSLIVKPEKLEEVFGWLEQHGGVQVQIWGWENNRRAALLAYSDGGEDAFGWSNWASSAHQDPSELIALFNPLELVVESEMATTLNATFLGAFTALPPTAS